MAPAPARASCVLCAAGIRKQPAADAQQKRAQLRPLQGPLLSPRPNLKLELIADTTLSARHSNNDDVRDSYTGYYGEEGDSDDDGEGEESYSETEEYWPCFLCRENTDVRYEEADVAS